MVFGKNVRMMYFPAHNLGRFMPRSRFESITAALTLAKENEEEEILSFRGFKRVLPESYHTVF